MWGPALTTLFWWPAFKGGVRAGARERGVTSRGVWVEGRTVLASECVPGVCGIHQYCLGTPVEQAVIWVAEFRGVLRPGRRPILAHKGRECRILLSAGPTAEPSPSGSPRLEVFLGEQSMTHGCE